MTVIKNNLIIFTYNNNNQFHFKTVFEIAYFESYVYCNRFLKTKKNFNYD